ncbi:TrkA C-terminal domain-containing protein [Thermoproteus tenax]|uniref:TrkA C-terminal domain-containing protein n=1 Tax=Thermoproteus tenax TaxID=2271 RepID=UPI000B03F4E5|nr:TrkA C-terminal domain-containing protein [Thermoproteus tenax]
MAKRALVLDSGDDLTRIVIEALAENGYIIHLVSNEDRGREFTKYPVYIHTIKSENYEELLNKIGLEDIEIALFISFNDSLNISLAKFCRSRGIPRVVAVLRNNRFEEEADKFGIIAVSASQCLLGRLYRVLDLKFTRITPIRGNIGFLEMLVTSDSKVLGHTIRDVDESYGVKAAILRGDEFTTSPDSEIQEGDYFMAIGPIDSLKDLSS